MDRHSNPDDVAKFNGATSSGIQRDHPLRRQLQTRHIGPLVVWRPRRGNLEEHVLVVPPLEGQTYLNRLPRKLQNRCCLVTTQVQP